MYRYNGGVAEPDVEICPDCGGSGWKVEKRGEREIATRCQCRVRDDPAAPLRRAHIPERYMHCTVESFELWDPKAPYLRQARDFTREFVDLYPRVERGLLYMGKPGTGKTHLAVAALRELVVAKGVQGLYVNFLELVQRLQMSFDGQGVRAEDLLAPVVNADVLVLDELGGGKTTQWVRDLVYYIVNTRYMSDRILLCTTNFKDAPASQAAATSQEASSGRYRYNEYAAETLADRIGTPVRSRLFEMCDEVWMDGRDYRSAHAVRQGRRK